MLGCHSGQTAPPTPMQELQLLYIPNSTQPIRFTPKIERSRQPTEKLSAYPHRRRIHAHATIEIVNAALPSNVFDVDDDHRCFPTRLPTIEAWGNNYQLPHDTVSTVTTHQSISDPNCKDTSELQQLGRSENTFSQTSRGHKNNDTNPSNQTEPAHPVNR